MMKKAASIFLFLIATFVLASCDTEEVRTYASDGIFLAYEASVSRNAPQVTTVYVEIENDAIKGYYIDARQGTRTGAGTTESPYVWAWNEKTKKELGTDYNMIGNSEINKEWFEQALAIETFWLENGIDAMTKDADGYIDNVTGASISDAYSHIAKQALANAVKGEFVSIYASGTDLYSAKMTRCSCTLQGIETLQLDVLQSTRNAVTGTFAWNAKTKQELGTDYGMKDVGASLAFANGAWTADGNSSSLEWFEQVNLITNYIIANGYDEQMKPVALRGGSLDGVTLIDALAGATIRTGGYFTTLKTLFSYAK
jgi:hypothetical protein